MIQRMQKVLTRMIRKVRMTLKQNVDPEYKNLIAIRARKRKGGIEDWFHDDPTSATRISLRETNLEKSVISHGADVIR